jgi:hypothetical protein
VVRARPCRCGSGRPARSCCGRFSRVSDAAAATGYLTRQARQARDVIGPFSSAALHALQREAASVPSRCELITAALVAAREPVITDLRHVARAVEREAAGRRRGALDAVLQRADTPMARVAVAKAFVALREAGSVDEHVTAAALIELTAPSSPIVEAALLQAGSSLCGLTPSGATPATTRLSVGVGASNAATRRTAHA